MTERITIACPSPLRREANKLASALIGGPLDGKTFRTPTWTDTQGNLFAVTSLLTATEWDFTPDTPVQRPARDVDRVIDVEAQIGRSKAW